MKKETKKPAKKAPEAKKTTTEELDGIVAAEVRKFEKNVLAVMKKRNICGRCMAERLPLHLTLWMGSVFAALGEYE